jgi:putative radical SAM enzyme (TIGR03279 family)
VAPYDGAVSFARVVAVDEGSLAARAGVLVGDELVTIGGEALRDVIQYRVLTDAPEVSLDLRRGGLDVSIDVVKAAGEPLGIEVDSAVFDRVRTCDNHCEFCFIYQLPKGMRRTLYLKDDDYRLSFLYGNFTTLTRFTESDLERVVTEGLTPLYVSIHATDPAVRSDLLRNRRGGVSLRWLRALLDHGVEVYGAIVVCPGLNVGAVLDDTLCGVLDEYPELASLALVPLGVSAHNTEPRMRPHTVAEAAAVVDCVERWQETYLDVLGRRLAYAADEYYLLAGRPFPPLEHYADAPMHEDGVGMARTFEAEFEGHERSATGTRAGFFAWAEATTGPSNPTGYTTPASRGCGPPSGPGTAVLAPAAAVGPPGGSGGDLVRLRPRRGAPVAILTGAYGARVLEPLVGRLDRHDVRIVPVENRFFGGNVGVAGLLVGDDLRRVLSAEPEGHRYLLPDVCLSEGRFLDGSTLADLPRAVEVVPTDGIALRAALEA